MGGIPTAYAAEDNLRGTVVDPKGNPIDGWLDVTTPTGVPVDSSYVSNGRIIGTVPESGDFRIEFDPSSSRLAGEFYLDKATLAEATPVAGAASVQLSPWTIGYAPFVKGVVTNADGEPLQQASVQVYDAATEAPEGGVIYTDDDGVFHAPAVGAEPVKVRVSYYGLGTEWFNDQPSFATATAVTPTSAGADLGNVVLTEGATIAGVVTSDGGAPLHRVYVEAINPGTGTTVTTDWTNAAGAYTLEGLMPGSYRIKASDSFIGEYLSEYYLNAQDAAAATLVPAAKDQAVTGINLSLAPVAAEPATGVDLTGKVVDEAGKPVVGTYVTVMTTHADEDDAIDLEGDYTNRQGVYAFDELDGLPGDAVKVYAYGFSPREVGEFGVEDAFFGNTDAYETATPVLVKSLPRTGADIMLVTNGGVSGKVTSDAGGRLRGAEAVFYDEDGEAVDYVSVKADGTYKTTTLEPGTYTVSFSAAEHISEYWNNAVRSSSTTVTVTSAKLVTGIDAVLTKTLVAVERPTIAGEPLVGSTLTADKGTWNRMAGATYGYEWLADGVVVGSGPSLVLTAAHFGKTMAVRVSSSVETYQNVFRGQAVTDSTAAVQAATTLKAKAKKGKVKLKAAAGTVDASLVDGKVLVKLQVTKKKLVKIVGGTVKNGRATIKIAKILGSKKLAKALSKLKPKKRKKAKLVFVFAGKNLVESQDAITLEKLRKANKKGKKGKN